MKKGSPSETLKRMPFWCWQCTFSSCERIGYLPCHNETVLAGIFKLVGEVNLEGLPSIVWTFDSNSDNNQKFSRIYIWAEQISRSKLLPVFSEGYITGNTCGCVQSETTELYLVISFSYNIIREISTFLVFDKIMATSYFPSPSLRQMFAGSICVFPAHP